MRRLVYQGSMVYEPTEQLVEAGGQVWIMRPAWWWAAAWMWRALGAVVVAAGLLALADR